MFKLHNTCIHSLLKHVIQIYIYLCTVVRTRYNMTRNARLRSRRPRYKAAVHLPDFDTIVPAPELSLPILLCRHISKGITFCFGAGTRVSNPVRERQLCSGDVGFVTWRSSSYIHRAPFSWVIR